MTTPMEILKIATGTLNLTGGQSVQEDEVFQRTAIIASVLLGHNISPYEASVMALADRLARMREASAADATYAGIATSAAYAGQMARMANLSDAQTNIRTQISITGNDVDLSGLSFLGKKNQADESPQ